MVYASGKSDLKSWVDMDLAGQHGAITARASLVLDSVVFLGIADDYGRRGYNEQDELGGMEGVDGNDWVNIEVPSLLVRTNCWVDGVQAPPAPAMMDAGTTINDVLVLHLPRPQLFTWFMSTTDFPCLFLVL